MVAAATVTDHIIAREQGGADYDPRNLMAMCRRHHDQKSGLEGAGVELASMRSMHGLIPVDRMDVVELLGRREGGRKPTGGWGPP